MISEEQVRTLLKEKLEGTGMYLVDVAVDPVNKIRVEIDHQDGTSIRQCVEVSRFLEGSLDREKEDFELQVSSPGLGNGFKVIEQYFKNIGKEVEVKTGDGKKQKGVLTKVDEKGFQLEITRKEKIEGKKKKQLITEVLPYNFEEVAETKRVISFK